MLSGSWNRLYAIVVPLASGSVPRADRGRCPNGAWLFWGGLRAKFSLSVNEHGLPLKENKK